MKKKILLLTILSIITLVALPLVSAQETHISGVRILPQEVEIGSEFKVRIEVSNIGFFVGLEEKFPDGFTFISSSVEEKSIIGNTFEAVVLQEDLINGKYIEYTLKAPSSPGTYEFEGTVLDDPEVGTYPIEGRYNIIVVDTSSNTPFASRTMPASVEPGEEFNVFMDVSYDGFARIHETIPEGFILKGSTLDEKAVEQSENTITFTIFGSDGDFSYALEAPDEEGTYQLRGFIEDANGQSNVSPNPSTVTVEDQGASGPRAFRALPMGPIGTGEAFKVRIDVADYGALGEVEETIPEGFGYIGSNLPQEAVIVSGNSVKFYLMGESSFEYTLKAPETTGSAQISGILKDENKQSYEVGGNKLIIVYDGPFVTAIRNMPIKVESGDEFTVTVSVSGYGKIGQLVETIPEGFEFIGSTLDPAAVKVIDASNIKFTLLNDENIEYTLRAVETDGEYSFSGILLDENKLSIPVSGSQNLNVGDLNGIVLLSGWNFISVPYALENPSVEYVLADIEYEEFIYYNAGFGIWEDATTVEPLKAYWIKTKGTGTQLISESVLEPLPLGGHTTPPELQLYEGWNAIGYAGSIPTSAEIALRSIDDCYTTIVAEDGTEGVNIDNYQPVPPKKVGTDVFKMYPYKGYWVFMTNEDLLGPA